MDDAERDIVICLKGKTYQLAGYATRSDLSITATFIPVPPLEKVGPAATGKTEGLAHYSVGLALNGVQWCVYADYKIGGGPVRRAVLAKFQGAQRRADAQVMRAMYAGTTPPREAASWPLIDGISVGTMTAGGEEWWEVHDGRGVGQTIAAFAGERAREMANLFASLRYCMRQSPNLTR